MSWLMHIAKRNDDGSWKPLGRAYSTKQAAEAARDAFLAEADPGSIVDYPIVPKP